MTLQKKCMRKLFLTPVTPISQTFFAWGPWIQYDPLTLTVLMIQIHKCRKKRVFFLYVLSYVSLIYHYPLPYIHICHIVLSHAS